jgi:hypothetical protein
MDGALGAGTLFTEATFRGQLESLRMEERPTILDGCCTQCMLNSVYDIFGANS